MKDERNTLRDPAENNKSMRQKSETDLAAARAVSDKLRVDMDAKYVELNAARSVSPADIAALQTVLDFMTKARDDAIVDARVARTSLSDAEIRIVFSSNTPSCSVTAFRARVTALTTSLSTSNKDIQ